LRQRVAFALSQIFVTSGVDNRLNYAMRNYQQLFLDKAFGNFEDILGSVTLSPEMGDYLNLVNNDKGDAAKGTLPNENYARELLQLFAIGLWEHDSGCGQPRQRRQGAAGWHGGQRGQGHERRSRLRPAQRFHASQRRALHRQAAHPEARYRQSVAAMSRVASVFNDNGQGVRGDLKTLVSAILLDPEARGAKKIDPGYGKLREPVLFMTGLARGVSAQSDGDFFINQSSNISSCTAQPEPSRTTRVCRRSPEIPLPWSTSSTRCS